ncbi:unnamed protein product [Trifolium pratense]|uniref:Uncharacterized protein n=1 Tax=Trifolium pratense TaxID=57577 RepID=A0ACB0I7S6_TRIPR|nr:unnamed protein product [Trifolium pratense]
MSTISPNNPTQNSTEINTKLIKNSLSPMMKMHNENATTSQDPTIQYVPTEETVTAEDPAETDSVVNFDDSDVQDKLEEYQNSFLGKIISEKTIRKNSIRNVLGNIWCNPKGFRVEQIDDKLFHFFMDEKIDTKRIIQGNPWVFRNSWLIVQPWKRDIDVRSLEFHHAPIWIQLWGLPPHCKTKQMGIKIGSASMGTAVLASELYKYPKNKLIVKIKVNLEIYKPIKAGIHIRSVKDGVHWIDFRYEKLPHFCFTCGLIGHIETNCKLRDTKTDAESTNQNVLGPWLRSNQFGRMFIDYKDRK